MNTRLLRRIIQLLLAALLLTGILLLAGGTAAAQTRVQRRGIVVRPIRTYRSFEFSLRQIQQEQLQQSVCLL